jgi:hypothetical protein
MHDMDRRHKGVLGQLHPLIEADKAVADTGTVCCHGRGQHGYRLPVTVHTDAGMQLGTGVQLTYLCWENGMPNESALQSGCYGQTRRANMWRLLFGYQDGWTSRP